MFFYVFLFLLGDSDVMCILFLGKWEGRGGLGGAQYRVLRATDRMVLRGEEIGCFFVYMVKGRG